MRQTVAPRDGCQGWAILIMSWRDVPPLRQHTPEREVIGRPEAQAGTLDPATLVRALVVRDGLSMQGGMRQAAGFLAGGGARLRAGARTSDFRWIFRSGDTIRYSAWRAVARFDGSARLH
jgi:hypothetical protein